MNVDEIRVFFRKVEERFVVLREFFERGYYVFVILSVYYVMFYCVRVFFFFKGIMLKSYVGVYV